MNFLKKLKNHLGKLNKDRHYAYYAFPALLALLVTFGIIRTALEINPNIALIVDGIHVHHFTEGIFILMITGYLSLWIENSPKLKYTLALVYGSGIAFVLDEFYAWLHLDSSQFRFDQYNAVVMGGAAFLLIIFWPMGIHGLKKLLGLNHENKDQENKTVFD